MSRDQHKHAGKVLPPEGCSSPRGRWRPLGTGGPDV